MSGIILGIMRTLASLIAQIFSAVLTRAETAIAADLKQRALMPRVARNVAIVIRHLCRPPAQWAAS